MVTGVGQFRVAQSVTLSASGGGQVTISPPVEWEVQLVSVSVSSAAAEPTFRLYLDGVVPSGFLEGTYSGSQDSSATTHRVQPGQQLIGVWADGDVGATATLVVRGEIV
jgi:hypothetical protein